MVGGNGIHWRNSWRTNESVLPQLPLMALPATALAIGIALAWNVPPLADRPPLIGLSISGLLLLLAFAAKWRDGRSASRSLVVGGSSLILLFLSILVLGAAWLGIRHHRIDPGDLAARLGDEAALVKVQGVALTSPVLRAPTGGALARFDYREPATYFPLRVNALVDRFGASHVVHGEILVRVDQAVAPFRAGDRVQATGFLLRPLPPANPGEFDYSQYARSLGQAGFLSVRQRDAVTVTPATRAFAYEWFLDWRDQLRRRGSAWLLSDLPATDRPVRDALLASIMLGERDEHIDGVYNSFQRVGLAHVLAISGFHLGILAAFVLLICRGVGAGQRVQGVIVLVFVALYLLMVEARMPVLRAGVMTAMACTGLIIGRRINVNGMLWFSAFVLLLWRPEQLFNAGFQLTFGVVLALLLFTRNVERRMPFAPERDSSSSASLVHQWLRTAMATAITAWVIALPIVIHHFGLVSPLAALLTVITLPLATIILAIGFLKMAIAAMLPSVALVIGIPMSIAADLFLSIVMTFDAMPFTVLHAPVPSALWTAVAMLCAIWLLAGDRWIIKSVSYINRFRRATPELSDSVFARRIVRPRRETWTVKWLLTAVLAAILVWPSQPVDGVRIDMLSVGDGSCYLIRSGESTVLFDAGSSTDLNIARRTILPALRHLGVRHIDTLIVSHADMDHYSAVLELVDDYQIREALMTPQLFAEAQNDPLGPVAFMLDRLSAKKVVIRSAVAGDKRTYGSSLWTWLHPQPNQEHRRSNDDSTVVRIEAGNRAILMCGDIQQDAMTQLLQTANQGIIDLRADVLELPHHGSYHETALKFVNHVRPTWVLQSTGWNRWRQDKWRQALPQEQRFVTARDGACTLHIRSDGTVETARYLDQP